MRDALESKTSDEAAASTQKIDHAPSEDHGEEYLANAVSSR